MTSTAQTIIDGALASSLANDLGTTPLANNTTELVRVISRAVRQVYTLAALPPEAGGFDQRHAAFVREVSHTVGKPATTWVTFPTSPEVIRLLGITDAGGDPVAMVPLTDVAWDVTEIPPAMVLADRKLRSAGRTGDPTAGATLTLLACYVPAELTAAAHFIGATTPTDDTTTAWPSAAGDQFLIDWLAHYLSRKDGRDDAELQSLTTALQQDAGILAGILGVSAARLAALQVDA